MTTFGQISRDPVAVTNKPLAANNAHSRGRADLAEKDSAGPLFTTGSNMETSD